MVATQSRRGSVPCAPSDAHCWTRRIASCFPDCQLQLRWGTACKWNRRRDDPTLLHVKLGQPEDHAEFQGEWWDVSGLPLSRSPDAVTDFLAGWKVSPVRTFRHGYRRAWVVRALEQPMAVIKRTAMQKARPNPEIQKWVPASDQKKTGRDAVFPQTWAAVVAKPAPQKARESREQNGQQRRWEHPSQAKH